MTRHQRRKAKIARDEAKTVRLVTAYRAHLVAEQVKLNLSNAHRPRRSEKGLGNRAIYTGCVPSYGR